MVMHTKKITMALFAIVIASSLIVVSGGLVGSAFAAKKKVKQDDAYGTVPTISTDKDKSSLPAVLREDNKSNSPKSQSANAGDSSGASGDTNSVSAKDLKSLSKCQSGAAADGDLTLAEVKGCYSQVF
jgi:hypothetical protein